jgi:hypothetical protein
MKILAFGQSTQQADSCSAVSKRGNCQVPLTGEALFELQLLNSGPESVDQSGVSRGSVLSSGTCTTVDYPRGFFNKNFWVHHARPIVRVACALTLVLLY